MDWDSLMDCHGAQNQGNSRLQGCAKGQPPNCCHEIGGAPKASPPFGATRLLEEILSLLAALPVLHSVFGLTHGLWSFLPFLVFPPALGLPATHQTLPICRNTEAPSRGFEAKIASMQISSRRSFPISPSDLIRL